MKKILFGLSVFLSTLISAQNYPDQYPTNNNNYYGDYDDSQYFPDDYYYEYPNDYYTPDFYESSYNDYRNSILDVNWNRFFATYRLSPWQMQQIMMLNNSYPSYNAWNSYYLYNPDRWYYDRFYALQSILGPRVFVVFQNNYYHGYNPVVYYQNHRRKHYVTNIYVVPKYRKVNIKKYKIDRVQYQQNNPRENFGFRDTPRTGNGNPRENGFRNDASLQNSNNNNGFRNSSDGRLSNTPRTENSGFRNNKTKIENSSSNNNGGFRNNDSGIRNTTPQKKVENNSGGFRNQKQEKSIPNNTTRTSAQRFTSR